MTCHKATARKPPATATSERRDGDGLMHNAWSVVVSSPVRNSYRLNRGKQSARELSIVYVCLIRKRKILKSDTSPDILKY